MQSNMWIQVIKYVPAYGITDLLMIPNPFDGIWYQDKALL